MSDFKPYEVEEVYACELTKDEALLIQSIRGMNYGSITVHLVSKKIVRTETVDSELMENRKNDSVTIAFERITK